MKLQKISLANIQGKLNRNEMKNIMAGSGGGLCYPPGTECSYYEAHTGMVIGTCQENSNHACVCKADISSVVWEDCKNP